MSQRLTVAAAVATIAASLSLYPLVSGWLWFWEGAGVVTVVALAGALTRLRALPPPVCALAGLAGVLFAARFGTVDASAGTGYELNVVAAVVVGGVAVFGGSGTVWGAGLGALLLTVISSALAVLDINQFWQQAIVGALIILAICADRLVAVRIARSLRKRDARA